MKNIIYGVGKHQREIEYVFRKLEIEYYLSDVEDIEKRVYTLERLRTESDYRVIICGEEKEKKVEKLKSLGLKAGENYILAEELYKELNGSFYMDALELPEWIAVWGTGKVAKILKSKYPYLRIAYYIDSDPGKNGTYLDGIEIKNPQEVEDWGKYFVVVAVNLCDDIINFLEEKKGLQEKKNYIRFKQINGAPSELMRKVCTAKTQNYSMCMQMFRFAFVGMGGEVHLCCPHMVYNIPCGNLIENTWEECWNSSIAKIMRLSLINKTFCFCDKTQCMVLHEENKVEYKEEDYLSDFRIQALSIPKELVLAFEDSCNLACTSCRKGFKFRPKEWENRILDVCTERLREVAQKVDKLTVSGNGDPLFSEFYRKLWMRQDENELQRKNISLITNGLLFNEFNWKKIDGLYESISLDISIDAATKETYESIRVGGNFDILSKNLDFIGKLRQSGKISHLMIRFVVQKKNYFEMAQFVVLGKNIHADVVYFCKIANWNMYTDEEYAEISMYDENDNMKPELMDVLMNPIFKEPIVDLSNMRIS
ncbi:hypothetical protein IMSAGC002_00934 [Lachnospiraceae bacterium]|nr:hypothetical protein IMSAGC002_00934 [Lachnospiraceae bacterium]